MPKSDVTPIRQQYLDVKRQYPNAIVFFRLGDFYETFDEDAEITSRELDIVLTSRNVAKGSRVPMAGIPYHAVENYLARLIERGYHVAICEQVGEQPEKGIFARKVVRVVTPGTVVEPTLLPGDANNYLVVVFTQENRAGLAFADITTGEFAATELNEEALQAELARLDPAEIILPENLNVKNGLKTNITAWPVWRFEPGRCEKEILDHFHATSLEAFGLKGLAVRATGVLLQYLQAAQPESLKLLTRVHHYNLSKYMTLDAASRRNLELTESLRGKRQGSLLDQLDQTVTPMGKRLILAWVSQPLLDSTPINNRLNGVEHFFQHSLLRTEMRTALHPLADIERLTNRILAGYAQPRDLVALRDTLTHLPTIRTILSKEVWSGSNTDIDICKKEAKLLKESLANEPPATLQQTGIIREGFSKELDSVIETSKHAREWIANLEGMERKRTGIKTLKVGYNKVFGYYIEISRAAAEKAPDEYIRKQTLVNAERFITPEMKEYETLVLNAEERIHEIELRLFKEVCAELANSAPRLIALARQLAELDVLGAFAEVAALNNYTKPEILTDITLDISEGRHPVVERTLPGERFVPNDVMFDHGEIIRIITGPNMSGKSTYLRQVALIVLMAQIGSFVPAASANIGLVDRIFTRIGAQDEIHAGQSTFMVEMIESASILHHATSRSLLILDEIGRGTSTYDGVSIAWAMVEYIHNHPELRARTLFATHYHELTQLADLLPGVSNYNVAVTEANNKVVFLHKIIPGGADRSYGIHVAQMAGLPDPVVQRANEIMRELERSAGEAVHIDELGAKQIALFPETNPMLDELKKLDVNGLSPIEALNKLFEWQKRFLDD